MKYWLLTTEYPPLHGGGISTYAFHTANMFAETGVDVTVFVQDKSVLDYQSAIAENGLRIIRFHPDRSKTAAYLGYTARLSFEFAKIVQQIIAQEGQPDIIESQDYLGIAYYLLQFKYLKYEELRNIPIILTLHSPAFLYFEYNRVSPYRFPDFWTCEMEKCSIKMADHLISPSHFLVRTLRQFVDVDNKSIDIIRNPYPVIVPANPGIIRTYKIVYYGKLSVQKGSFEMFAYFKKMWMQGFPHPLHIIGGADIFFHPEQMTMGQLVERDYGEYIRQGLILMHGKINSQQLENELNDAHVIIVPSLVDNLPYVVIEAMSLGKIVLASVQGGQQEMIDHGVNGFLFDHTINGDFQEKLLFILSLGKEEIGIIGEAARKKVRLMYDRRKIGTAKITLLKEVIQNKTTGSLYPFLHQETYQPLPAKNALEKLSVIIPYYNMGKYIDECIMSINASSCKHIEILIIDDGSTEAESIEKLQGLSLQDHVKILRKENEGLAAARNYGALQATGKWIAFLDADDTIAPLYYQKAIDILQQYDNVFFVGCCVQYFGESIKKWMAFTPQPPYALVHNPVVGGGLVYKKEAFLQTGLNDTSLDYGLEDYDSIVALLAGGFNGVVIPEFWYNYRIRANSMFRKLTREKLLYSYKLITEKHAAYFGKFAASVVNLINANGPGYLYDNPTFSTKVYVKTSNILLTKAKELIKSNKTLKRIALKLIKLKSGS